jgi:hypothetical protein
MRGIHLRATNNAQNPREEEMAFHTEGQVRSRRTPGGSHSAVRYEARRVSGCPSGVMCAVGGDAEAAIC